MGQKNENNKKKTIYGSIVQSSTHVWSRGMGRECKK